MSLEESGAKRQPGDVVGDYRLVELVSRGAGTRTWRAEQISIQRPVMLEMLQQDWAHDEDVRTGFLADVRAKASINQATIGHVYEAHSEEAGTYLAREVVDGTCMEALHEAGTKLKPRAVAGQIEMLAAAYLHLEQQGIATVGLAPHHLILNEANGEIRMINLAVHGPPHPEQGTMDKVLLGELYEDFLTPGLPGSVRTASLLDYMADVSRPETLTWDQIHRLAKQVREELTDTEALQEVVAEEKKAARSRSRSANIWALLGGLGLILALLYFFLKKEEMAPVEEVKEEEVKEIAPVGISTGGHFFKIAAHEVTIREYAEFLEYLTKLPESKRLVYDHKEQPSEKQNHVPTDWEVMLEAAKAGSSWSGRPINENCPVVGVDYWDAYAFCQWDDSRLPTAEEWIAAAAVGSMPRGVSDWGDATLSTEDRTGEGLIGMAGNVSEWTSSLERNPAFPLNAKQPLACGGSFVNPGSGSKTRVFIENRQIRRGDLGFRTVR